MYSITRYDTFVIKRNYRYKSGRFQLHSRVKAVTSFFMTYLLYTNIYDNQNKSFPNGKVISLILYAMHRIPSKQFLTYEIYLL